MVREGSTGESLPEEAGDRDPVMDALSAKLEDLRSFGGKTGEVALSRYEKLQARIEKGDKRAYAEVARELGLEEALMGERELSSKGMKPKELTEKEVGDIEGNLDRFD